MAELKQFYTITSKDKEQSEDMCYFKRPTLLGFVESKNNVRGDPNKLDYFKLPEKDSFPLDLNVPFENFKFREYGINCKLNNITWFINDQACYGRNLLEKSDDVENANKIQVVTHRGVLALLMESVNNMKSFKWTIRALKYKGILYLMQVDREQLQNKPLTHKPAETHHLKLRKLCFVDDPNKKPEPVTEFNENYHTSSMFASQLENISLLYSCELDGVMSKKPVEIHNIEEMRKCQFVHVRSVYKTLPFHFKMSKFMYLWINAYLENVNDLFIAYKNKHGIVEERLRHMQVQRMPLNQKWCPGVMNRFAHTFINKVAEIMKDVDSKNICYEFCLEEENIKYRIYEGDEFSFLSKDYIEFVEANF